MAIDAQNRPIPYVDAILAGLVQVGVGLPVAFEAVRAILALFRTADPSAPIPTDADVIALLKARALRDKEANDAWLKAKGYL